MLQEYIVHCKIFPQGKHKRKTFIWRCTIAYANWELIEQCNTWIKCRRRWEKISQNLHFVIFFRNLPKYLKSYLLTAPPISFVTQLSGTIFCLTPPIKLISAVKLSRRAPLYIFAFLLRGPSFVCSTFFVSFFSPVYYNVGLWFMLRLRNLQR